MRARKIPPRLRESLQRGQDDVRAQQTQQKNEPPGVEHIEKAQEVQQSDGLRGIDLLDLAFLRHRPLENDGPDNYRCPQ